MGAGAALAADTSNVMDEAITEERIMCESQHQFAI
jgi:hypothetical protein